MRDGSLGGEVAYVRWERMARWKRAACCREARARYIM
jgi:hypothetical protein